MRLLVNRFISSSNVHVVCGLYKGYSGLGQKLDTLQGNLNNLKDAQKNVRDQVHELQTCQRSLATREEIIEEITNQRE